MSAYKTYNTVYRKEHQDILVDALKEMGYAVETHKNPVNLYGFTGDKRQETAHVIVRRKHLGTASNDIGWLYGIDGATAHISEYDHFVFGKEKQSQLAQLYGKKYVSKKALKNGWRLASEKSVDGSIQLQYVKV